MNENNLHPIYHSTMNTQELIERYKAGERYFTEIDIPDGSNLCDSTLADVTFESSWLSDVDFRGANLRDVRFLNCNVKCSDFRGADLEGAIFTGSLVEATYFAGANLSGVSFAGSSVYDNELKHGDMPDSEGRF